MGAGGRVSGVGYPPPVIAPVLLVSFVLRAAQSEHTAAEFKSQPIEHTYRIKFTRTIIIDTSVKMT